MADLKKIPKHTRLFLNRPPLVTESMEVVDLLARMDLPRYQPPKTASRSRSRKGAKPDAKKSEAVVPRPVDEAKHPAPPVRNPLVDRPAGAPPTVNAEKRNGMVHPFAPERVNGSGISQPSLIEKRNGTAKPPAPEGLNGVDKPPAANRFQAILQTEPKEKEQPRPEEQQQTEPISEFEFFPDVPSLKDLLLESTDLPNQTAILGVCDDQLPVLLDLNDPAPGSVLVVSDERQQELDLLRVAISSVVLRNTARGAQFIVISHLPDAWTQWIEEYGFQRYCLAVVGAETPQAREWIYRLTEWGIQRQAGMRGGPPVLVLFDTLSFLTRLSADPRQKLEELVAYGPQAGIWSLAAVSTALANSLARQLDIFPTHIYGYSEDTGFYTRVAGLSMLEARTFGQPGQFAVRLEDEGQVCWLKFRLPSLEGINV